MIDINTKEGMQASIAWTQRCLSLLVEGGVWFVPRAASSYRVSHVNKTLTRTGMKPDSSINKVAAAMGWTVIEKEMK
jgi:hypothetical protein